MEYKSILILATGLNDEPAIARGVALAAAHGGIARVLPVYPDIASDLAALTGGFAGMPISAYEAATEFSEERHKKIELAAADAAFALGIPFRPGSDAPRLEMCPYDRMVWRALSRACILADLVLISGTLLASDQEWRAELVEDVLMRQRRPLLIVRDAGALPGRSVVAWNGRIEAARAVAAALHMLRSASGVDVVTYLDGVDPHSPTADDLCRYLKLHGVSGPTSATVEGDDAVNALLDACRLREAKLLVVGAYGHSRLREVVFGGVTKGLLTTLNGPSLLLAH